MQVFLPFLRQKAGFRGPFCPFFPSCSPTHPSCNHFLRKEEGNSRYPFGLLFICPATRSISDIFCRTCNKAAAIVVLIDRRAFHRCRTAAEGKGRGTLRQAIKANSEGAPMKLTRRLAFIPVLLAGTLLLAAAILFASIAAGCRAVSHNAEVSASPLSAAVVCATGTAD